MDIHTIFRGISHRIYSQFQSTIQIQHSVSQGTVRENVLKKFLEDNKFLPLNYGIGSGQIINRKNRFSRQSDLIIYDQIDGIPFFYDESVQIFPIECIYGIIEVKSKLSKQKLIEALENIKSVKELSPREIVNQSIVNRKDSTFSFSYTRPIPFGIVFAYDLDQNSLETLMQNLHEWEQDKPTYFWPNLVVVLNKGIIYHKDDNNKCYSDEEITSDSTPAYILYEEDTLLHFYSILLDLCRNMPITPFDFSSYLDLPIEIGNHYIKPYFYQYKQDDDGFDQPYTLNENFIEKVISWCTSNGKLTYEEIFLKQMGTIPEGVRPEELTIKAYLYNPDNLPGIHEIENYSGREISVANTIYYEIDGELYLIPSSYITDDELVEVSDRKFIYRAGNI